LTIMRTSPQLSRVTAVYENLPQVTVQHAIP
jgi:hypothetical protein